MRVLRARARRRSLRRRWRQPQLRCWSHLDERSAAFFALGLAKATRAPVALVCTSGTAAANFHPAVIEAHHARVPLLRADGGPPAGAARVGGRADDRPAAPLRRRGALVRGGSGARKAARRALRYARALACRAVAVAKGRPAGPVHLNLPFREPLEPVAVPGDVAPTSAIEPLAADGRGEARLHQADDEPGRAGAAARGLAGGAPARIRAGRHRLRAARRDAALARGHRAARRRARLAAPRRADLAAAPRPARGGRSRRRDLGPLPARRGHRRTARARRACCASATTPTSKASGSGLERHRPRASAAGRPRRRLERPEPPGLSVLRVDPAALCDAVLRQPRRAPRGAAARWLRRLPGRGAPHRARRSSAASPTRSRCSSRARCASSREALPDGSPALRLEQHAGARPRRLPAPATPRPLRVLCNRGANGIDGMISSALGAAAADRGRVVLLTGDLAFLHDPAGCSRRAATRCAPRSSCSTTTAAGSSRSCRSPSTARPCGFEEYFRDAPRPRPRRRRRGFGARFTRVGSWEHFRAALKECVRRRRASRSSRCPWTATATSPTCGTSIAPSRRRSPEAARREPRRVARRPRRSKRAALRLHAVARGRGAARARAARLHRLAPRAWRASPRACASAFRSVRIDLVGHGAQRRAPATPLAPYTMESCVDAGGGRRSTRSASRPAHVLGYSMGGRVALALCAWRPERVRSALLDRRARGPRRRRARARRAGATTRRWPSASSARGVERFVDCWMALPLFASQRRLGEAALAAARAQRLANRAHGLAQRLRGMGSGRPAAAPRSAALAYACRSARGRATIDAQLRSHRLGPREPPPERARRSSFPARATPPPREARRPSSASRGAFFEVARSTADAATAAAMHPTRQPSSRKGPHELRRLEDREKLRRHPLREERGRHRQDHHQPARGAQRLPAAARSSS